MKKYIGLFVMFFIISCTVWSDDMAFKKKRWQASNFQEKIGNEEAARRKDITRSPLLSKTIEIGQWNMDTTGAVQMPHEVSDYRKIRFIKVHIRSDDDTSISDLMYSADGATASGAYVLRETLLQLYRHTGGLYDSATYNLTAGSFNRGWITLFYEN